MLFLLKICIEVTVLHLHVMYPDLFHDLCSLNNLLVASWLRSKTAKPTFRAPAEEYGLDAETITLFGIMRLSHLAFAMSCPGRPGQGIVEQRFNDWVV